MGFYWSYCPVKLQKFSRCLTKWWKSELMLATNFGSLCPKVTKVGSQNFGYQIWFCTRLITVPQVYKSLIYPVEMLISIIKFSIIIFSIYHTFHGPIRVNQNVFCTSQPCRLNGPGVILHKNIYQFGMVCFMCGELAEPITKEDTQISSICFLPWALRYKDKQI